MPTRTAAVLPTPTWARELLDRHWPAAKPRPEVQFLTRSMRSKLGDTNGRRIRVMGSASRPEPELQRTFRHEIAHNVAGLYAKHGPAFRAALAAIEHADGVPHDVRYTPFCGTCGPSAVAEYYGKPVQRFRPGQRVTWRSAYGGVQTGVVLRLNRLSVGIRNDATGQSWRVSPGLLSLVEPALALAADATPEVFRPAPPLTVVPGVVSGKCSHRWVVDKNHEDTVRYSASGRAKYWERDQHCPKCGTVQVRAKWSQTVK